MDWDDFRFILAVAREGSLGKAARSLGTTQPTVSRRLNAFERRTGVKIFERARGGLEATELGLALIENLLRMEESSFAIQRRISSCSVGLQGRITVTSLDWLGDYVIAPIAAAFGNMHRSLEMELHNEGRLYNLSRQDADIAIRFLRFEQEDIYERRVAEVSYGLYASQDYLTQRGIPDFDHGCEGHCLATLHEAAGPVCQVAWLFSIAPRAKVIMRASGIQSQVAATRAGLAMAALPRFVGDGIVGLSRLQPPHPEPHQPVRLGVHADMRNVPRIRAFIDFLADTLKQQACILAPDA
ncbi:LysR family transcriptional regulator [Pseudomonas aeruginosa]